jgi:hypothetical protein
VANSTDVRVLALAGSLSKPLIWLLVIMIATFAAVAVALTKVFEHLPAGKGPPVPALYLSIAIAVIALFFVLRILLRTRVYIEQGELVVNYGIGSRRIPLSSLRKHGLRKIDLAQHTELKPFVRTWGAGMPGFHAGWFRLRNGERALCVLLDRDRVSYLRSDEDNMSLLLSLEHPETLHALLER